MSFGIAEGQKVPLVGPGGAVESTLAHILLRFWEYQEGHILLSDQELRQYAEEDVRALIALVSQHTHLFNTTIRENLLLASTGGCGGAAGLVTIL